jgi:hypothetical protein
VAASHGTLPTMYWAMLYYPEASKYGLKKIADTLRLCVSGGAAMPVEAMKGDSVSRFWRATAFLKPALLPALVAWINR